MALFLIGKSNNAQSFINDANRKTVKKRHKWGKNLLLTTDATVGTVETRFLLQKKNFHISGFANSHYENIGDVIMNVSRGTFPVIEISVSDIFGDSTVTAVDHVTEYALKSRTHTTCTSTNVDLDPESFPNGVLDLIEMIEDMEDAESQ